MISTDELKALLEKADQWPWSFDAGGSCNYMRDAAGNPMMCDEQYYPYIVMCDESWKIAAMAPELAARIIALDQAIGMLEELVSCQPEVHSGRARDPQDDVPDMIEHSYLTDLQYDARKVLESLGVTK